MALAGTTNLGARTDSDHVNPTYDTDANQAVDQAAMEGPPAQLSAYPLPLGTDTDSDLGGTDLTDGTTVVWDASAAAVPKAQLGGPAASLSGYPLALATDTDLDLGSTDLTDGTTVVWDASAGHVPAGQVDPTIDADTVDGKHASDVGRSENVFEGFAPGFTG